MATYNVQDIVDRLNEIKKAGYSLVNINILEADSDFKESLSFEAVVDDFETVDYETVESIDE